HRPSGDTGEAHDVGRRCDDFQCRSVVLALPGEGADFPERALVDELGHALADGETAALVMLADRLRAAQRHRLAAALPELLDLGAPVVRALAGVAHRESTATTWPSLIAAFSSTINLSIMPPCSAMT